MAGSLWKEALEKLPPQDKISFTSNSTDAITVLQELLKLAEAKKDVCLQKRWKFTRGGEDIIIRDQVDKIITWVERFKEIGSIAVQYDPTSAALPWAGVMLILQITCNDSQTFGAMIDGIEGVSSLITRCSVIEQLCMGSGLNSPARDQLRVALVKVYISILRYLCIAHQYFSKGTLRRIIKSAVTTPEMEVQRHLDIITKKAKFVHQCLVFVQTEEQRTLNAKSTRILELLRKIEEPIVRCSTQLADIHRHLTRQEKTRIMAWLSTVNVRMHHDSQAQDYLDGSCIWLFDHLNFQCWRSSSASSIVWLHGMPGCGKTKLIYYAISRLLEEAAAVQNSSPILYFYCTRNPAEVKRSVPVEIMRSLLKQLAIANPQGAIRDLVIDLFKNKDEIAESQGYELEQLTMSECTAAIIALLEQQPATIVIDALDEVDPLERHQLMIALNSIIRDSSSLVKVLVASRDDGDIRCHLSEVPNIYVRADDNARDLQRFIHHSVKKALESKRLLNGQISDELTSYLTEALEQKAMGMFRWVSVQIDNLCDSRKVKIEDDVREEIARLPATLQASYDQNYDRIKQLARPSKLIAERTIKWLLCAQKLLNIEELSSALITARENRKLSAHDILDICCNMVVVDGHGYFRFAHLSVREFFETHQEYQPADCHTVVLQRCLNAYTNTSLDWRYHAYHDSDLVVKPYAMRNWPHHFESISKFSWDDNLHRLIEEFFFCGDILSEVFRDWLNDVSSFAQYPSMNDDETESLENIEAIISDPHTPLFFACYYDSVWVLEKMKDQNFRNWNQLNGASQSAAYVAVQRRSHKAMAWLLQTRLMRPDKMIDALYLAVEDKETTMAKALIEYGVDGMLFDKPNRTALEMATKSGQYNIAREILRQPHERDSSQNIGPLLSSIHVVLESRTEDLISLLWSLLVGLEPSTFIRIFFQLKSRIELREQMLNHARDSDIVLLNQFSLFSDLFGSVFELMCLLKSGIIATSHGSSYMIRYRPLLFVLLESLKISSIELSGSDSDSDLDEVMGECGIDKASEMTISVLLDIQWLYLNEDGWDEWDNRLLAPDIEVLKSLGAGSSPTGWLLMLATRHWKSLRLVSQILEKGVDVNVQDPKGRTPLMFAVRYGLHDILTLLLDHSANTTAVDNHEMNATHYAIILEDLVSLGVLLDKGIDVNVRGPDGYTPLMVASMLGHCDILTLLLDHHADIMAVDDHKRTAIYHAIDSGEVLSVGILLDRGANPIAPCDGDLTPLDIAVVKCMHTTIDLLRERGVRRPGVRTRYSTGQSCSKMLALPYLAFASCEQCIKSLLGQSPSQHEDDGFLAILEKAFPDVFGDSTIVSDSEFDYSSKSGTAESRLEKVPLVLGTLDGFTLVNLHSVEDGITPLQIASALGSVQMVHQLLEVGVDINAVDHQGFSALHYAMASWKSDMHSLLDLLLFHKADPYLQDIHGQTALHIAVGMSLKSKLQQRLMKSMSHLNVQDINGDTPLHVAVQIDDVTATRLLLSAGADCTLANNIGLSAIDIARATRGDVLNEFLDILDVFSDYYSTLFDPDATENENDPQEVLNPLLPKGPKPSVDTSEMSARLPDDLDSSIDYFGSYGVQEFSELSIGGDHPLRPLNSSYVSSYRR